MPQIDRQVVRRFWAAPRHPARDPRAVTLDRWPRVLAELEVALYQSWSFRRLEMLHPRWQLAVDLGCGNGAWTVSLARRARRIVAVDQSEVLLAETRQRLEEAGLADRTELARADLGAFVPPAGADVIMAGAVVQYLDDADTRALFARIARALAAGGIAYVRTTLTRAAKTVVHRGAGYHAVYRPDAWYRAAFSAAGLEVVHQASNRTFLPDELARRLRLPASLLRAVWGWFVRNARTEVGVYLLRRAAQAPLPPPPLTESPVVSS